jgi:superfamily I DNA/RNA helicase
MARRCDPGVVGAARPAITDGTPPSKIAILYRFNATQARFEAAFARAEITTVVVDDTTFFDREEVRAPSAGQPGPGLTKPAGS